MPVSIDTLVKRNNDPKSSATKIKKTVFDKAFTGNGNNSRGYINTVNNTMKNFVEDVWKKHQDAENDLNRSYFNTYERKNVQFHPFLHGIRELECDGLGYEHLLTTSIPVITGDTKDNNDMFDINNDDKWSAIYEDINGHKVSTRIVPTRLIRHRYGRKGKKTNVFTSDFIIVNKYEMNPGQSFGYKFLEDDELGYFLQNVSSLNENLVVISPLVDDYYTDFNQAKADIQLVTDENQKWFYNEIKDEGFNVIDIYDLAAQEVTNEFVDLNSRGFAFWGQMYEAAVTNPNRIAGKDAFQKKIFQIFQSLNMSFDELPKDIQDVRVLDDYQTLYKVQKHVNDKYVHLGDALFSQSLTLSLRLNDNLGKLKEAANNGQLYDFDPQDKNVDKVVNQSKNFSVAQKKLLTAKEPLIVGVAGAGSGKSHTIVGRLAYLQQQQEDMSKVLVLSFTNTAADNIKARYPKVRSLTLSKLFHEMYKLNFANQQLSDDAVLSASLQLINENSSYFTNRGYKAKDIRQVISNLSSILHDMSSFRPRYSVNAYLNALSQIINDNFKAVIDILDSIQQVSITLEPIIINAMLMNNSIQNINIPAEIQNINFIITDESQDISTFEYVLLTELTVRYGANLMIVGDSTQTLYEFRDSNPDFLNTIESSDVFKLYRLNRNYRSNNDILAMGNQFLDVIRANRFAKMQLTSNNVTPATKASFTKNVQLENIVLPDMKNNEVYAKDLGNDITKNTRLLKWVASKMRKGEQVGILAFTKAEAKIAEKTITQALNDGASTFGLTKEVKSGSLIKDQKRPSSLITDSVASMNLSDVAAQPSVDRQMSAFKKAFKDAVYHQLRKASAQFVPYYASEAIDSFVGSTTGQTMINAVLTTKTDASRKMLYNYITKILLDAEIKHNQQNTYLSLTTDDDDTVDKILNSCDIVSSTIHSAKGLEFDNCIVIYRQTEAKSRNVKGYEEKLRLFGVALTRAEKQEYILNTLSQKDSQRSISHDQVGMYVSPMQTGYARVMDDLQAQANPTKTVQP